MASATVGFWSYTHDDNAADDGRLVRLAERIAIEFSAITAEDLEIFVDRNSLEWGDEWATRIDNAVSSATFFIPIVTPRYFQSEACRSELLKFTAEAARLGVEQLLLPVYWLTVPGFGDDDVDDEAIRVVASRQWADLRAVRLVDEGSAEFRQAVNDLATRISHISEALTVSLPRPDVSAEESASGDAAEADESPGLVDMMAEAEEALPRIAETLEQIGIEIETLAELSVEATRMVEEADARGAKPAAARLRSATWLARALDDPAAKLAALGHSYAADLVKVDPMVLTLLDEPVTNASEAADKAAFAKSVVELVRASSPAIEGLTGMLSGMEEAARLSMPLRNPVRKIRLALRGVLDGRSIIERWGTRAADATAELETQLHDSVSDGDGDVEPKREDEDEDEDRLS